MEIQYALVERGDVFDIYQIGIKQLEDEDEGYVSISRGARPLFTIPLDSFNNTVDALAAIADAIQRGNYFSSVEDMDSNYEL